MVPTEMTNTKNELIIYTVARIPTGIIFSSSGCSLHCTLIVMKMTPKRTGSIAETTPQSHVIMSRNIYRYALDLRRT